jgi:chromosome segregation ATPase
MLTVEELREEISHLQQEVQQKDLLVQQLSEELFRLIKGNNVFVPTQEFSHQHQEELLALSHKLATTEEKLARSQSLQEEREMEAVELRKAFEEMSDRTRMLEQVVQELPNVYRGKFAERMVPIKAKVEMLQKENRQLHMELQSLSYRLAVRSKPQRVELPKMMHNSPDLPIFRNA